ncbi:hypothetical protein [Lentzea sp.]|uniref:hypothetical protein n=1 Tax=Lentzea sp. TaxID=56099 RepID=UPI002BAF530B|nr:hypothetical protein [Lentzea sp.]HUQ55758.1 hypothetical protein [Lentzea sp.]
MYAWQVVFSAPKQGNDPWEWEDGAAAAPEDRETGRGPRFALADGATEGFGSTRWAMRLVEGFVAPDVELTRRSLLGWAVRAQDGWRHDPVLSRASGVELFKLDSVGSFATFLGCELTGLAGERPRWRAVAVGDTVLFHVRGNRLVGQFPPMRADDFGVNPAGVPTVPAALPGVVDRMEFAEGDVEPGDLLYLATDALAQWMVREDDDGLWSLLAGLDHPHRFRELADDRRETREMTNDDVTLMRISVAASWPDQLVVCV